MLSCVGFQSSDRINFSLHEFSSQKEDVGAWLAETSHVEEFGLFWFFIGREDKDDELADQLNFVCVPLTKLN